MNELQARQGFKLIQIMSKIHIKKVCTIPRVISVDTLQVYKAQTEVNIKEYSIHLYIEQPAEKCDIKRNLYNFVSLK